ANIISNIRQEQVQQTEVWQKPAQGRYKYS
ncbi:hypothetical protein A2U01_0028261, partial [Trifolium medium]|nr:hypothetical protein [Trifolium medium]